MTYRTAALGLGACFVVLAFISLLVAMTTNYWLIIQVNRSQDLNVGTLAAYSRHRGLFKECFNNRAETKVCKSEFSFRTYLVF